MLSMTLDLVPAETKLPCGVEEKHIDGERAVSRNIILGRVSMTVHCSQSPFAGKRENRRRMLGSSAKIWQQQIARLSEPAILTGHKGRPFTPVIGCPVGHAGDGCGLLFSWPWQTLFLFAHRSGTAQLPDRTF